MTGENNFQERLESMAVGRLLALALGRLVSSEGKDEELISNMTRRFPEIVSVATIGEAYDTLLCLYEATDGQVELSEFFANFETFRIKPVFEAQFPTPHETADRICAEIYPRLKEYLHVSLEQIWVRDCGRSEGFEAFEKKMTDPIADVPAAFEALKKIL